MGFREACKAAGIDATRRQFSKWTRGHGAARIVAAGGSVVVKVCKGNGGRLAPPTVARAPDEAPGTGPKRATARRALCLTESQP